MVVDGHIMCHPPAGHVVSQRHRQLRVGHHLYKQQRLAAMGDSHLHGGTNGPAVARWAKDLEGSEGVAFLQFVLLHLLQRACQLHATGVNHMLVKLG